MLLVLSALAFVSVSLIVVGAVRPALRVDERGARELPGSSLWELVQRSVCGLLDRPWVRPLAARLDQRLERAGRPAGLRSGLELLAASTLAALLAGSGLAGLSLAVGASPSMALAGALLSALATFASTQLWLDGRLIARQRQIARELPFFLDLGVMCLDGGASAQEAIEIYVRDRSGALAEELEGALREIELGRSLGEALELVARRAGVPGLDATVAAVVQAQTLGTSLGPILRERTEQVRFERAQLAERRAEEVKVRMQGPVMLMMIAALLLILGPAALRVLQSGIL